VSIKPAYHVFLSPTQKRLIAEISAIQSQVEWLMRLAVQHCLGCEPATARTIMGSTSIAANAKIWFDVICEAYADNEIALDWADAAYAGIAKLAEDRNSYLHTLYAHRDGDDENDFNVAFSHQLSKADRARLPAAVKARTEKAVSLNDLKKARDHAAQLSIIFAYFEWELLDMGAPSPFERRLAALPPMPPHTPRAERAKARQRQQKSSPA
jgi:hypothetical protein